MSNEKPDETRKLSEEEMEAAKGGETFATLSTFTVTKQFSTTTSPTTTLNKAAQTVMCGGQTRDLNANFSKTTNVR
jgi:hypothetical protein